MARNIKKRLEALEGGRSKADQDEDEDGLRSEIAEAERQACLIAAWHQHHKLSVPIGSVLPDMLRYVDESEARLQLSLSGYRHAQPHGSRECGTSSEARGKGNATGPSAGVASWSIARRPGISCWSIGSG